METLRVNESSFKTYPMNRVCAIIGDDADARKAVDELLKNGIPEDHINIFSGTGPLEGAYTRERSSFLAKVANALRAYGDVENEAMRIYGEAMKNGEYIFEVIAGNNDQKELIHQILANRHARQINYFGSWYIEAMTEATSSQ